jgi:hypothetical protein
MAGGQARICLVFRAAGGVRLFSSVAPIHCRMFSASLYARDCPFAGLIFRHG